MSAVEQPVTPLDRDAIRSVGTAHPRVDGPLKVTGRAAYAVEHREAPYDAQPLHAWLVQSTVARGRVLAVDAGRALAHDGVVTVLDHTSAPRLTLPDDEAERDREHEVLQDDRIDFRGQVVALVLAETSEAAREAAGLVEVTYDEQPHRAAFEETDDTYEPETVNPAMPARTEEGDVDGALAGAAVVVDATYETAIEHNNPLEPHAAIAHWDGEVLTLADSTQGVHPVAQTLAPLLGLEQAQLHVVAPYVGGGFGSKGVPHAPEVAVAMAAMAAPGRAVRLAVTRQQMFALTGYRTPTRSHFRLGADADGRLVAIEHEVLEPTSRWKEFGEQTASPTRMMYAARHRRTGHRLVPLDVAVPSWMRAPGEMPGMFAHEVAMDELAVACGVDPVELRVRNEPDLDPETGKPFSRRGLVDCLRRGAERFGWTERPAEARATRDGDWWVGTGVAAATYPAMLNAGNEARITAEDGGHYDVAIGAVDIGTGARTVLQQIAADALGIDASCVRLRIADTDLPSATVAGGSSGTASWGAAIVATAQRFRADHGDAPDPGVWTQAEATDAQSEEHALHSFGATFAEVRVHRWTGEVRLPRLLGVYSVGRVINPLTARSQLLGGLVMGLSAGLFEESFRDPRTGHVVTQDLATYHVASHADVRDLQVEWLDEEDPLASPVGGRGIGEIGIVGTAASIANAAYHATGTRVRSIPVTADRFLTTP
jgi:xanthine dehydrogenase YagR molybdenum-binding subunit